MSVIESAKEKNNINTSEELLGIVTPPEFQCKNMDYLVEKFKIINKLTGRYDNEDCNEMSSIIDDVNWESDYAWDEVEKLRTEVENLRQWGQEWKNLAKSFFEDGKISIEDYI